MALKGFDPKKVKTKAQLVAFLEGLMEVEKTLDNSERGELAWTYDCIFSMSRHLDTFLEELVHDEAHENLHDLIKEWCPEFTKGVEHYTPLDIEGIKLFRLRTANLGELYLQPIFSYNKGKITLFEYPYIKEEQIAELLKAVPSVDKLPYNILRKHPRLEFLDTTGPCVVSLHSTGGSAWESVDPSQCWGMPNEEEGLLLYHAIQHAIDSSNEDELCVNIEIPESTTIQAALKEAEELIFEV